MVPQATPYKCYYCPKQYAEREHVVKHIGEEHPGRQSLVYTDVATLRKLEECVQKSICLMETDGKI